MTGPGHAVPFVALGDKDIVKNKQALGRYVPLRPRLVAEGPIILDNIQSEGVVHVFRGNKGPIFRCRVLVDTQHNDESVVKPT